ncbi:uncharacterized protein BDZ99DRAFT_515331 [Mytilinidion resinicola]|uniref:Uncharacterized protein n=1 Tax=Mytilinidion resinicola TaxID=574789 RepID=A0A6A6Z1K1_9PEZI|nr:uncharacterized protein BDZ99DRAFT_515331 [Mytilinidion resinicola]KAF2814543.1 hypothetical protein BDZ99DRAFT_515331 [Mytilinidion resinicola]
MDGGMDGGRMDDDDDGIDRGHPVGEPAEGDDGADTVGVMYSNNNSDDSVSLLGNPEEYDARDSTYSASSESTKSHSALSMTSSNVFELVERFNGLEYSKYNSPTHWYFDVRHLDLQSGSGHVEDVDLLFLWNTNTDYVHIEGPFKIVDIPTTAEEAETIVRMLLVAFSSPTRNMNQCSYVTSRTPLVLPTTWDTKDPGLASAIESELTRLGVRRELCEVSTGTLRKLGLWRIDSSSISQRKSKL